MRFAVAVALAVVGCKTSLGVPRWISGDTKAPEKSAPVIYRDFRLDTLPSHVEITLAVAGWHELSVNGRPVADVVLSPVTCQPNLRISSVTRDITKLLRTGENRIEVLLGNGWFNCFTKDVWGFSSAPWQDAPMIRGALRVDGRTLLETDGTWRVCDSPIVFNALRNGEWYDARKEGLREHDRPATVVKYPPYAEVSPEDAAPCRAFDPIPPVRSFAAGDGGTIYDFGSNRSGWCEIEVAGEADKVAAELVRRIREGGHRAAFGILGAKWVPRVLSDHGYIEDAWRLFVQPDYPGWARWMSKTDTLWELWEDTTTSFNHIMFGDLSAWAFEYLAGIKIVEAGFRKVEVKPYLPEGVEGFSATYATPEGKIRVCARRENGRPVYEHTPFQEGDKR